jgi:hypothetical protein
MAVPGDEQVSRLRVWTMPFSWAAERPFTTWSA